MATANKYTIGEERRKHLEHCADLRNECRRLVQRVNKALEDINDPDTRETLENVAAELEDQAVCIWFAEQELERKPAA